VAERSFVVSKEYLEDLGERDDDGYYDYAYSYWAYSFDFGDREYWPGSIPIRLRRQVWVGR
jgi:hypothetical protein